MSKPKPKTKPVGAWPKGDTNYNRDPNVNHGKSTPYEWKKGAEERREAYYEQDDRAMKYRLRQGQRQAEDDYDAEHGTGAWRAAKRAADRAAERAAEVDSNVQPIEAWPENEDGYRYPPGGYHDPALSDYNHRAFKETVMEQDTHDRAMRMREQKRREQRERQMMDMEAPVAPVTSCANHTCAKESSSPINCPNCLSVAYCSEACRYVDWVTHACPNATLVQARTVQTSFVPYWGEDGFSAEEIAKLPANAAPFQSYTVDTRLPDDSIVHLRVDPIAARAAYKRQLLTSNTGRGTEPAQALKGSTYSIDIIPGDGSGSGINLGGIVDIDALWDGNVTTRVKKLLGRESNMPGQLALRGGNWARSKGSLLRLWPDNSPLEHNLDTRFPLQGTLSVVITHPISGHLMRVEGPYNLKSASSRQVEVLGGLRKQFQPRLHAKLGKSKDLADMFGLRAQYQDITVLLIMHVPKGSPFAKLRDVEVAFPQYRFLDEPASAVNVERPITSIACNPSSLEDCTAMAMALELRATRAKLAGTPVDAGLDNAAGIVRRHQRSMPATADDEVSMEVNTAIYTALASI